MVRIAVLSEHLAAQLRIVLAGSGPPPSELTGIDVVWSGSSLSEFKQRVPALRPQVLAVDLAQISASGEPRRSELDALLQLTGAELVLVLYSFAARDQLRQLAAVGERTRAIKTPLSLSALRLNMLSLLVRDTLQSPDATTASGTHSAPASASVSASPAASPSANPPTSVSSSTGGSPASTAQSGPRSRMIGGDDDFGAPLPVGAARLFSQAQLGRLQEITSSVRCECPNHMAELVSSLAAFEEYSKKCENRDDADAAMHAKLYRETSRARRLMEEALVALCRYERIDL
jgi:hypothetical protein